MYRTFRKYHRLLGLISALPLLITMLAGVVYTLLGDWLHHYEMGAVLMQIHTLQFLKLGRFYPFLIGLSLFGLIVSGLSMSRVFAPKPKPEA